MLTFKVLSVLLIYSETKTLAVFDDKIALCNKQWL